MTGKTIKKAAFLLHGCDVHILEQESCFANHIVIRAPCAVVAASLVKCKSINKSLIIITTQNNQIWMVPLDQTRFKQIDFTTAMGCDIEKSEDNEMDTEDIFQDLPNDETKRASSCQEPHCFENRDNFTENNSVFTIMPHHLLYSVDGMVIDVDSLDDLVSVLVDQSGNAELLIFKVNTEQRCSETKEKNRILLLERYTTNLDSSNFYNYFKKKTKCLFFAKPQQKICTSTTSASFTVSESDFISLTSICIPSLLFAILFGKEAAFICSPVIILCTDNGSVFSYEVSSVRSVLHKRLNLLCQMDSSIAGILPITILLPAVSEVSESDDIISALASSLKGDSAANVNSHSSSCLVILSSSGKGCLFLSPTPENGHSHILMFSLPHSVLSYIFHGESLIYSTGKSVEACELKLEQGQGFDSFSVTPLLRTVMGKARIQRLLPFALVRGDKKDTISGITCSFDLVSISTQHVSEQDSKTEVTEVTSSLKEIFQSIEQCSLIFKSIKKDSVNIDSLLVQLNLFASLATVQAQKVDCSPCSLDTTDFSNQFISCACSVFSSQNVYSYNWSLKLVLHNSSIVSLSDDWIVFVTLNESNVGLYNHTRERFHQNFSIPLSSSLKSKTSMDIILPLDKLLEIHPTPSLDIKVSLVLCFKNGSKSSRSVITNTNMIADMFKRSMKVKIHNQTIDICYFLCEFNAQNSKPKFRSGDTLTSSTERGDEHWFQCELDKMAREQVTGQIKGDKQEKSQIVNIRLGISELQRKELKFFTAKEVILFLLKDSNIPVDRILGPHIQLEDALGHIITMMVSTFTGGAESLDKPVCESNPFVLVLKGEEPNLLLQLRAAIKFRLKVHSSETSVLKTKSCGKLRRQLAFLEEVQKDIDKIRSQLVVHKDESMRLVCEMIDKTELLALHF